MAAAALALARAARAQLQALQPTVEQQQAEIDRVQLRASECGMVEKTAGKSGVAGMIQRGWNSWDGGTLFNKIRVPKRMGRPKGQGTRRWDDS